MYIYIMTLSDMERRSDRRRALSLRYSWAFCTASDGVAWLLCLSEETKHYNCSSTNWCLDFIAVSFFLQIP